MTSKVFADTSAWISYSLSGQYKHSTVKNLIKKLIKDGIRVYTSNDVIDETITRLIYDANPSVVKKFIEYILRSIKTGNLIQLWVDEEIQVEGFRKVEKFIEHRLSLTDATTLVLMDKFKIEVVITLDSDFKKVGVSMLP